jgi:hypothetical protein
MAPVKVTEAAVDEQALAVGLKNGTICQARH